MEKIRDGEDKRWRRKEMEKIRDGETQKKEDAGARTGRKVAKHHVFPMFCGSRGSKRRGSLERMKKCTPLWREAHLEVKMHNTHHGRSTFGS